MFASSVETDPADPLCQFEALRQDGIAVDPDQFCAAHPEHPNLRRRIEAFERLCADLDHLARPLADPGALTSPGPVLEPGTKVGPYRVARQIGSGGMGRVYLAQHLRLERSCALKILADDDAHLLARLSREAQLGARLDPPGIATVFDVGKDDGYAYVASEFVVGFPLRRLLSAAGRVSDGDGLEWLTAALIELTGVEGSRTGLAAPPVDSVVRLASSLAWALAHAHGRGVIHRDVKPSNIIVRLSGQPVLIDFGIAVGRDNDSPLTRTGVFIGTYDYAAPEQLLGEAQELGPWTDTYALGATLYEMLAQRTPFEAASLPDRLAEAHLHPAKGPRHFNPRVPARLEAVVMQALDPDPASRFHDGEELADALAAAQAGGLGRWAWPVARRARRLPTRLRLLLAGLVALALLSTLALGVTLLELHGARSQLEQERRQTAERVMAKTLPRHQADFQACLRGEIPLLPAAGRGLRFRASLTVFDGIVREVQVSPTNEFSWRASRCLVEKLRRLSLPGVAPSEELILPVTIDLAH